MKWLDTAVAALRRTILGISPEEIRYTFEDVRSEIRAVRAELKEDLTRLREEIGEIPHHEDKAKGPEIPVAEA